MTAVNQQTLQQLLQQQFKQVGIYQQYLDQIKAAISGDDAQRLQKLVANPPPEGDSIEQNQRQLQQMLIEAGYSQGLQEMDAWLAEHALAPELPILWKDLKQSLKLLEQALFINNLLLQKSQQRIKQSIRLLAGHTIAGEPASYSRQGDAESASDSQRILAQA